MTYYLLRVQDIPESGRDFNLSAETDKWFKKAVKESISGNVEAFDATLTARISKIERSIEVVGGIYIKMKLMCDRCTENFDYEQQIPFRFLLEPAKQAKSKDADYNEDISEIDDSLDFSYYDGDEVDIGDLIRQHIVMSQTIRHICREDCKGLCDRCGKNLNEGPCDCSNDSKESPFAVLKDYGQKAHKN